jgi:hypothetical protein
MYYLKSLSLEQARDTSSAFVHIKRRVRGERQSYMLCSAREKRGHERAAARKNGYLVAPSYKPLAERKYVCLSSPRSHTVAKHKYPHNLSPFLYSEAIIPTKTAVKTPFARLGQKNMPDTLEKAELL